MNSGISLTPRATSPTASTPPAPSSSPKTYYSDHAIGLILNKNIPESELLLTADAWEKLQMAASKAKQYNLNIFLTSGYRSNKVQTDINNSRAGNNNTKFPRPPTAHPRGYCPVYQTCAKCPGKPTFFQGSKHSIGQAVDVQIYNKGENRWKQCQDIMFDAGFVRYRAETWHFEYGSSNWERCQKNGTQLF